jgi:exosortase H (IPTLxxWG-CTERM-specific)
MANPETPANRTEAPSGAVSAQAARSRMKRFLIIFPICLLAGFGLLLAPFSQSAVTGFTVGVVKICARVVSLCGGHIMAAHDVLTNPSTGFSIRVEDTCNASNVTVLLWAAILAFPAPWRQKTKGLLAGTLVLHGVNLFRIISLFYIGQQDPGLFEFVHLYVWESLIVVVTLAIFWSWVQRTYRVGQP